MSSGWRDIIDSVREGAGGPWMCPECDEVAVELGQRFVRRGVVESTLLCLACEAGADGAGSLR
ncbi:hypothetical protein [Promicromonospora sp. NPDC090134]|uniref:hypothetical protein n=1 Tax=Promicromonospora sp. NPDC090134 TaxID=3364408 RepID=UPI003830C7DA